MDARRHFGQPHGEQRRREVLRDPIRQGTGRRLRSPDVELGAGIPKRREEPEALQMIQMEMAEQDVDPFRRRSVERRPERADPCSGIQDHEAPVIEAHLDARRVPPGADGVRTRRGERAARAPEPGAHVRPPRSAPRRRPIRRRADPPERTAGCRRPRANAGSPSAASIQNPPRLGIPVLNAVASGRSSSRSGSPASSTGFTALARSAVVICASAYGCPRMRSAGSLKNTRLPEASTTSIGVARFAARSFARIRAMCRCFGGAGSVTQATVHHEPRSRRRYPRAWRRLGSWWAPRSSKPTRGRRALWRVRFPSASATETAIVVRLHSGLSRAAMIARYAPRFDDHGGPVREVETPEERGGPPRADTDHADHWSGSRRVVQVRPHVWNWLAPRVGGGSVLEIGPGLRPTAPVATSTFIDASAHALNRLAARGGRDRACRGSAPVPGRVFRCGARLRGPRACRR